MSVIGGILPAADVLLLQNDYDRNEMTELLGSKLSTIYDPSTAYGEAIKDAFYGPLPADDALPPREQLSVRDRERVLIALLAAGDAGFSLSLHVYMALMEGISADEIAHVIFLTAIYSGVSNLGQGLKVEATTLTVLKNQVAKNLPLDVVSIFDALRAVFEP